MSLNVISRQTHLSDLLNAVRDGKPLPKCYQKLSPFLQEGILRVGGRLTKIDLLSDAEKYPIYVAEKHANF